LSQCKNTLYSFVLKIIFQFQKESGMETRNIHKSTRIRAHYVKFHITEIPGKA